MQLEFRGLIFAGLTAFAAVACAQSASPGAGTAAPSAFPSRVLRQTTFNIPFTVETARQPLEVQLYLSRDRGQTWKLYARQNPSAKFFPFHASGDGEYWFASQTINASGPPSDIAGRQPELHVVIDTVQPDFNLQAAIGPSREIQVSWRCSDPTIDAASLKIEYQAGREQPWQPVDAESAPASNGTISGRLTFVPRTAWVELQVRAEISDLARNKAVVTRRLSSAVAATGPDQRQLRWRPVGSRNPERPVALPPTSPETRGVASAAERASGIPIDPYANARPSDVDYTPVSQNTTGFAAPAPTDVAPSTEWKTINQSADRGSNDDATARQGAIASRDPDHEFVSGGRYQPQPGQVHPLVSQQITGAAATDPLSDRAAFEATTPSPIRTDSNQVSVMPVRMTSATRFEVDYEFDAAAANGVRSVELWGTRDRGQTWSRWQVDADRQSPIDVQVDADGTYGFQIVIVGNNGLAGEAPRNGDDADLWIGVDTTPPVVKITTATYGRDEHAGKLAIGWTAADASFAENPISIFFSDNVAGPWTTIAAGVPNSGQYYWPIDPRVPEQLYLRIEAHDRAGNQGEYRLPDSVNLSGFTPKARIRGFRPVKPAPGSGPSDLDSAPQATRNPYVYR